MSWSKNYDKCPRYEIITEQLGMLNDHICMCVVITWLGWEGTSVRGADGSGNLACLTAPFWLIEESLKKTVMLQTGLQIVTSLLQKLHCQHHNAFQVYLVPA